MEKVYNMKDQIRNAHKEIETKKESEWNTRNKTQWQKWRMLLMGESVDFLKQPRKEWVSFGIGLFYFFFIHLNYICYLFFQLYWDQNWQKTLCKFKEYNMIMLNKYTLGNDHHNKVSQHIHDLLQPPFLSFFLFFGFLFCFENI